LIRLPFRQRREFGQHFLADENIVAVAARLAELSAQDVVLEVGPGLGVLTKVLAERAAFVHAIEIDRSLEPHLRELLAQKVNVNVVFGDALAYPLAELDPPPNKFVANLPYNVATPLVVESLDGLPTVELWCVMVQREVADRFFASPGTKSYGAVSVLVQLTCERVGFHSVSRTVFRPPPKVDSALVAFRRGRSWGPEFGRVKEIVQAAFAHRRKTLANSLALVGLAARADVVASLERLDRPPEARAEALAPEEFVRLADLLP
jgi:16S rRNA (adenine1518-N6/adenine1519-N6)-dimethyltransferase